jgi:hypothetical protein
MRSPILHFGISSMLSNHVSFPLHYCLTFWTGSEPQKSSGEKDFLSINKSAESEHRIILSESEWMQKKFQTHIHYNVMMYHESAFWSTNSLWP